MTIKPIINQKTSEKKESHAESQSPNVRTNHRTVLVQKSSTEGQSPQRRTDVFDELNRHRCSPHKNSATRSKRDHHKREQREKHGSSPAQYQVHSPHTSATSSCVSSNKSPKHGHNLVASPLATSAAITPQSQVQSPTGHLGISIIDKTGSPKSSGDPYSGYNSGDEHLVPGETLLTPDEWKLRDEKFIKAMSERGFIIHDIIEDGACLFRAISLQIFGDQDMHEVIRQQTMDYIYQNREYFAHFVTEDITTYVKRKRNKESHGNHIEIQAMSEIYNRPVELYCYQTTPTNIFNSEQINNGYDPLRLSYQRGSHYNAIMDPYNASVGVGLGLAGYKPESQTHEAIRLSEQQQIEQTMFEDKLKTTDWEATNEAIEEQIARESYLQWCRENMQRARGTTTTVTKSTSTLSSANSTLSSATITSATSSSGQFGGGGGGSSSFETTHHSAGGSNSKDSFTIDSDRQSSPSNRLTIGGDSSVAAVSVAVSNSLQSATVASSVAAGGPQDCYDDSDDTDISSSTSGSADLYKDKFAVNKFKYRRTSPTRLTRRQLKRRHRDTSDSKKCLCDSSMKHDGVACCNHKRLKPSTKLVPAEDVDKSTVELQQQQQQQLHQIKLQRYQHLMNNNNNFQYDGPPPCTSKQAAQLIAPVSTFYQSLLESSYAEDGIGQLSEGEMIMKAIHLSRVDFFENVKRRCQSTDEECSALTKRQCPNSTGKGIVLSAAANTESVHDATQNVAKCDKLLSSNSSRCNHAEDPDNPSS